MGTYDTPGGTPRNNPSFDNEAPCEIYGKFADECECPDCDVCGTQGCIEHRKEVI